MNRSRSLDPLRRDLERRVFRIGMPALADRVGLEVEYLLRERESGEPVRLDGPGGAREVVAELARERSWRKVLPGGPAPRWEAPCGCAVTFEPGGQLEVASPPASTLMTVFECMDEVTVPLRSRLVRRGWELLSVAIDPRHSPEHVHLELSTSRYRRMTEHFNRLGPAGARMMRQTASVHINVDLGSQPLVRWRVANALAPILAAVFANSTVYRGSPTGYRNYRSWQWRLLDPSRTGAPGTGLDPVEEYLRFALAAPAILAGPANEDAQPFLVWWQRYGDLEAWRAHLSTLFPEVRPRGYLELRSVDILPERWLPVPVAFVLGILYSDASLAEAERSLPYPSEQMLRIAAHRGLADPELRERAAVAWRLSLQGMTDRPDVVSPAHLLQAREFRETFTARGLDPASSYEADFASVESNP